MKPLRGFLLCLALCACGLMQGQEPPATPAQTEPKPLLFAALPDSFEVDKQNVANLFSLKVDDDVQMQLSGSFLLEGKVVDKNQHNPGSITLNIRLSNYSGALFNISMMLLADNSTGIQGRILHPRFGDVLQLYPLDERYFIKKVSRTLYMPE